jgi:hypothetical protein
LRQLKGDDLLPVFVGATRPPDDVAVGRKPAANVEPETSALDVVSVCGRKKQVVVEARN